MMFERRGRPVLGAILALLFGIFLTVDLLFLGMFALDSPLVLVLPVLFLVVGFVLGWVAPLSFLRRGSATPGA